METVKKPEVLLTVGNTVAIVGVSVYFYKQIAALKSELSELTEHLKTSVKKFQNIQENVASKTEMEKYLTALNLKIEQTQKNIQDMDSGDGLELLEDALEDLSELLTESGVEWSYPPKRRRRGRGTRGGKKKKSRTSRRKAYSESESDTESDSDSDSDVERSIAKVRGKSGKKGKSRRKG